MQGTPINNCPKGASGKNIWEMGNLGNSLSNSLVTVYVLKLLIDNPCCGSDQLSKNPSIGKP